MSNIHYIDRRREQQRAELERRSGMERRIRADKAMRELRDRRDFSERRCDARRSEDNAFVDSWIQRFTAARAARAI